MVRSLRGMFCLPSLVSAGAIQAGGIPITMKRYYHPEVKMVDMIQSKKRKSHMTENDENLDVALTHRKKLP